MNVFEVTRILATQGADRHALAMVLEAMHDAELLPTWGKGQTGVDLSTREAVSVVLAATAPDPAAAAQHAIDVAGLIRQDGFSLGEALTAAVGAEPHTIAIDQVEISADSQSAIIRYTGGKSDVFYTNGGLKAFRQACIIRGSLLSAIALKISHPTESGWKEKSSEHEER